MMIPFKNSLMERPGSQPLLKNGDTLSARLLLEKGQKIVLTTDGTHRVCTLFALDKVLYFRDSQGEFHLLPEGEVRVPHSGGLKIRFHETSLTLSFWMEPSTPPLTSTVDHFRSDEKKNFINLIRSKPVSSPILTKRRVVFAALVAAALAGGVAFMASRAGCAEEPGEDAASH